MEEQIVNTPELPSEFEVVDIQFRPGQKVYFFDPAGFSLQPGTPVIIDTARGPEYGICVNGNHIIPQKDVVAPLRPVIRLATAQDTRMVAENQGKEKKAYEICLQKIQEHGLDMQLVSAECAFDGSRILFFFTADDRVDFRELVKDLASAFHHTRIELRQIGVRDKAKMVGGLGICGRPFCCASFLDDFQPVSIKMAKTQNLSLNPTKISGTCGRLMCCLKYEQDAYEELLRTAPKAESFVDTPEGRGTVVEVDLLRQRVKVKMEEHPEIINVFANADIAILRSGKAKKNDPPIPLDVAPISGVQKQEQKPQIQVEKPVTLEAIHFRYSTETVADAEIPEEEISEEVTEVAEETPAQTEEPAPHRNANRRHKPRRVNPVRAEQETAAPSKKPAPKQHNEAKKEQPAEEPQEGAKPARRPYHHHRRFHKPAGKKPEA